MAKQPGQDENSSPDPQQTVKSLCQRGQSPVLTTKPMVFLQHPFYNHPRRDKAGMVRKSLSAEIDVICKNLNHQSVVLIGLMGVGKSSVGRRLADKLGLPFVDSDYEIEAAAGMTIPEIFSDHGESYFREGERRVIARLIENGPQVLATGGGAFLNPQTRQSISQHGVSVWLRADLDLLMRRVQKRNNRPLLHNDDPRAVMARLMAERHPIYAHADIIVESRDVQHNHMVNDVIRSLAKWPGWQEVMEKNNVEC